MKKVSSFLFKTCLIVLSLILSVTAVLAQEYYKTNTNGMWVFEKPDNTSIRLLTTKDIIEVVEIQGDWAKVKIYPFNTKNAYNAAKINSLKDNDGVIYGFVQTNRIKKTNKPRNLDIRAANYAKNADVTHVSDLFEIHLSENVAKLTDIVNLKLSADVVVILTFIILGLSIGMHIMGRMWHEDGEFEGLQLPLFAILFTAVCILELIIAMSGVNPIWFCSPGKIGWFLSIIGLFVFVYVINNQIKCFRLLMNELTSEYGYYSLRSKSYLTGILSGIIGFVVLCFYALMLFGQGDVSASKSVFWTIASAVAALQILQAVIIYNRLESKKIVVSSIYLIGMFATFVTLMYFMALLIIAIIVIVVWVLLFIFAKIQQSGRSTSTSTTSNEDEGFDNVAADCRSCSRYPGHAKYCDLGRRHVSDFRSTWACKFYRI